MNVEYAIYSLRWLVTINNTIESLKVMARASVILAAGDGKRMRSATPKVLHQVGGRPMIDWVIESARRVECDPILVVVSPNQPSLISEVEHKLGRDSLVFQTEPNGTGDAVSSTKSSLENFNGTVLVQYGDTPLLSHDSIEKLVQSTELRGGMSVLGFEMSHPTSYGRLVTDEEGNVSEIVEAKDANESQRMIRLCNSGIMAVKKDDLFSLLATVTNKNAANEYYLTDIIEIGQSRGIKTNLVLCSESEALGVNTQQDLANIEGVFQEYARSMMLDDGVTLIAPETVYFSYDTKIDPGVIIEPNVIFGPNVTVSTGVRIKAFSYIEGTTIASGCEIGPFARLRPNSVLHNNVKIGNFVEVKQTEIGSGTKANHLAYLGDGNVGAGVNIGAGVIFCNFDGHQKFVTTIENGAFIGSNASLVAPVTVGKGAYIATGSVVTEDVTEDSLLIARARQREVPEWAINFRAKNASRKDEGLQES